MREILISIKPEWVEKILNGEKTIEIRKTIPKCELPVKVYIYCTNAKPYLYRLNDDNEFELTNKLRFQEDCFVKDYNVQNRKVVAEFTLNDADFIKMPTNLPYEFLDKSCLNGSEIMEYLGGDFYKNFYAWHIDNLKIYDKPKELCDFKHWVVDCQGWCNKKNKTENVYVLEDVKRPPQSWCYVEGGVCCE